MWFVRKEKQETQINKKQPDKKDKLLIPLTWFLGVQEKIVLVSWSKLRWDGEPCTHRIRSINSVVPSEKSKHCKSRVPPTLVIPFVRIVRITTRLRNDEGTSGPPVEGRGTYTRPELLNGLTIWRLRSSILRKIWVGPEDSSHWDLWGLPSKYSFYLLTVIKFSDLKPHQIIYRSLLFSWVHSRSSLSVDD